MNSLPLSIRFLFLPSPPQKLHHPLLRSLPPLQSSLPPPDHPPHQLYNQLLPQSHRLKLHYSPMFSCPLHHPPQKLLPPTPPSPPPPPSPSNFLYPKISSASSLS